MTQWASPEDVEAEAAGWTDAVVTCRAYGHSWRPATVTSHNGAYTIRQRCNRRCGTERECAMDSRGHYMKRWQIKYREGYLMEHLGRVDQEGRARIRLASIRNLPVFEVGDDE
jgi:hypothetical protein